MIEFINRYSNSPDFTLGVFALSFMLCFSVYTVVRKRHTPFKDDYLSGVLWVIVIGSLFASIFGLFMPRIMLIRNADELLKSKDFINSVIFFYFAILMICYIKFYETSFTKEKYDCIRKENVRPYFDGLDFMFGVVFTMIFSLILSAATFFTIEHSKPFVNKLIQENFINKPPVEKEFIPIQKRDPVKTKIIIEKDKMSFAIHFDRSKLKIEIPKDWYVKNKNAIIRFSAPESGEAAFLTFNNISDKNTCLNVISEASKLNSRMVWLQNKSACDNISNNFALIIPIQ